MPTFNVTERQVQESAQSGASQINEGTFSGFFDGQRQLGQSLRKAGRTISAIGKRERDFQEKMAAARDSNNSQSAITQFDENIGKKLLDFERRNDFENFEDEFNKSALETRAKIMSDARISERAKQDLNLRLDRIQSGNSLQMQSLVNRKEIDSFRANHSTNLNFAREEGDLERANEITREDFANNVIGPQEREKELAENEQIINFNNAKDWVKAFPGDVNAALESFPLNKKGREKLKQFSASLVEEQRKLRRDEFNAGLKQALNNPEGFDLELAEELIDTTRDTEKGIVGLEEAEDLKKMFRDQDETNRNKMFSEGKKSIDAYYIDLETSGDFNLPDELERLEIAQRQGRIDPDDAARKRQKLVEIGGRNRTSEAKARLKLLESSFRLGEIDRVTAKVQTQALIKEYSRTIPGPELSQALELFETIGSEVTSETNKSVKKVDSLVKALPAGFRGELFGDDIDDHKEFLKEAGEEINKIKNPRQREAARRDFFKQLDEKNAFTNNIYDSMQVFIATNPNATDQDIENEFRRIVAPELKKDAFKKSSIFTRASEGFRNILGALRTDTDRKGPAAFKF